MKSNQEIINELGKLIVDDIIDRQVKGNTKAIFDGFKNPTKKIYNQLFDELNEDQKKTLQLYVNDLIKSMLFDFLGFFEENEQFKLIYEEAGEQVDLNKISEMLKAEPIIEGGWIERFSKELKS